MHTIIVYVFIRYSLMVVTYDTRLSILHTILAYAMQLTSITSKYSLKIFTIQYSYSCDTIIKQSTHTLSTHSHIHMYTMFSVIQLLDLCIIYDIQKRYSSMYVCYSFKIFLYDIYYYSIIWYMYVCPYVSAKIDTIFIYDIQIRYSSMYVIHSR